MTIRITRKFVETLRLSTERHYRIAIRAGVHPTTLSRILNGAERVQNADPRVTAIARVLGLDPAECLEAASDE